MIKIEKDIPIPAMRGAASELRRTLKKMKPSESILMPVKMRGSVRR